MALTNAQLKQKLADKIARDKARLRDLEAKETATARKLDTRAKILIGGAMLADAKLHPETRALLEAVLSRAITKDRDLEVLRAVGLAPSEKP